MMKRVNGSIASRIGTNLFRYGVRCISLLLVLATLTGCGRRHTETLAVCKEDSDSVYVFDSDLNYYIMDVSGNSITPIRNVGLPDKPAISVVPRDCKYTFIRLTEGKYSGDLDDVSGYLYRLNSDGYTAELVERTDNYYECRLFGAEMSVRLIYTSDNIVRLYAKKYDETYCNPPYING